MNDEIKEIYLCNLEWIKTHDNMGCIKTEVVFKKSISYEEYEKILETTDFILCNKDYITNLQQENERLKQPQIFIDTEDMEERYGEELYKDYLKEQLDDYKSRCKKAIEYIKSIDEGILNSMFLDESYISNYGAIELLNILQNGDNNVSSRD